MVFFLFFGIFGSMLVCWCWRGFFVRIWEWVIGEGICCIVNFKIFFFWGSLRVVILWVNGFVWVMVRVGFWKFLLLKWDRNCYNYVISEDWRRYYMVVVCSVGVIYMVLYLWIINVWWVYGLVVYMFLLCWIVGFWWRLYIGDVSGKFGVGVGSWMLWVLIFWRWILFLLRE